LQNYRGLLLGLLVGFESVCGGFCSILELLVEFFICSFRVFSSGIPGVGVAPRGKGLPIFFGSGIPGVGVAPFGIRFILTEFGSGIPGVEFADIGSGLAENSGGRFALFKFVTALTFVFVFGVSTAEQAIFIANKRLIKTNKKIFII
jgi:hypothetical protein